MRITAINELPDADQRSGWAEILKCDPSTLYRAEKAKLLEGVKGRGGHVMYTKESILAWLGLEVVEVTPPSAIQLQPIPRTRKQLMPAAK